MIPSDQMPLLQKCVGDVSAWWREHRSANAQEIWEFISAVVSALNKGLKHGGRGVIEDEFEATLQLYGLWIQHSARLAWIAL